MQPMVWPQTVASPRGSHFLPVAQTCMGRMAPECLYREGLGQKSDGQLGRGLSGSCVTQSKYIYLDLPFIAQEVKGGNRS